MFKKNHHMNAGHDGKNINDDTTMIQRKDSEYKFTVCILLCGHAFLPQRFDLGMRQMGTQERRWGCCGFLVGGGGGGGGSCGGADCAGSCGGGCSNCGTGRRRGCDVDVVDVVDVVVVVVVVVAHFGCVAGALRSLVWMDE